MSRSASTGHPAERTPRPQGARRFRAFEGWPADDIDVIRELGDVELFSAGAVVLGADPQPHREVVVVLSGRLQVDCAGRERAACESFHPGDVVGAASFIDGRPEPGLVRSLEPSTVLRLRASAIVRLAAAQPELALRIVFEIGAVLADRFRTAERAGAGADITGQ